MKSARIQRMLGVAVTSVLAAGALGGLPGCQSEDKILKYKPFFTNVSGAVTATPAVGVEDGGLGAPKTASSTTGEGYEGAGGGEPIDPTSLADSYYDRLAKLPDHMVKLEAGDIGTLIRHLRWTLDEDRSDVLIDQLFAEDLLAELRSRNQDPEEYVDWLYDNRREIEQMFARMPMAERSPTVVYEQTARRQYRVRLTGAAGRGMKFTELWVAMERGKYRLLWIS